MDILVSNTTQTVFSKPIPIVWEDRGETKTCSLPGVKISFDKATEVVTIISNLNRDTIAIIKNITNDSEWALPYSTFRKGLGKTMKYILTIVELYLIDDEGIPTIKTWVVSFDLTKDR